MNTPRTDAMEAALETGNFVKRVAKAMEFARVLERELTASNARIEALESLIRERMKYSQQAEGSEASRRSIAAIFAAMKGQS